MNNDYKTLPMCTFHVKGNPTGLTQDTTYCMNLSDIQKDILIKNDFACRIDLSGVECCVKEGNNLKLVGGLDVDLATMDASYSSLDPACMFYEADKPKGMKTDVTCCVNLSKDQKNELTSAGFHYMPNTEGMEFYIKEGNHLDSISFI